MHSRLPRGPALVDEALNPQIAVESRDGRLDL